MLDTILRRICCEGDEEKPSQWLSSDSFVMCISDLSMRDEEVFVNIQKFFEYPLDSAEKKSPPTQLLDPFGHDLFNVDAHDDNFLEANSKSLNDAFPFLSMSRTLPDSPDDTPFGTSTHGLLFQGVTVLR